MSVDSDLQLEVDAFIVATGVLWWMQVDLGQVYECACPKISSGNLFFTAYKVTAQQLHGT